MTMPASIYSFQFIALFFNSEYQVPSYIEELRLLDNYVHIYHNLEIKTQKTTHNKTNVYCN